MTSVLEEPVSMADETLASGEVAVVPMSATVSTKQLMALCS
jgi:hypothetical protein